MTGYLNQHVDPDDPALVSAIDELPLWSAPFGYRLLDAIVMKRGMNVLDVGCGLGFPAIEVAVRLGESSVVTGIDPWGAALDRARLKKRVYGIENVHFVQGHAEDMPFDDNLYDLIVSNNGINNVEDMEQSLAECYRVCKPGGQMVITLNLEDTMIEFYSVFRDVLERSGAPDAAQRVRDQIHSKRRPLDEIRRNIGGAGFEIGNIEHDSFRFRFADGSAMLNYYVIRYWFMEGWKDVVDEEYRERVFADVERRLNDVAAKNGELALTIPFVTIDCRK